MKKENIKMHKICKPNGTWFFHPVRRDLSILPWNMCIQETKSELEIYLCIPLTRLTTVLKKGDSISKVRGKRSTSKSGFF